MQPDSRNLLTYNSTTLSVRSVQWPFFIFIQKYLKNIYNTCSAMLLYSTLLSFFNRQLNPVSTSTLSSNESENERERERERVVNASERSRHERSVKRPLLLFCILFHPPPSSAPLSCPPLSESQSCSRAEAIWYSPKSTATPERVRVWNRGRNKSYCLHCIEFASPQCVELCEYMSDMSVFSRKD